MNLDIFYASDIHGSELLWRKFLNAGPFYRAGVLIMGGDVSGKGIVPIVEHPAGSFRSRYLGEELRLQSVSELEDFEKRVRFGGMYPLRCSPEMLAELGAMDPESQEGLLDELREQAFRSWLEMADRKLESSKLPCFVMPGNDDPVILDKAFDSSRLVHNCDRRVIDLGNGYSLLSLGFSNRTPWDSPRELDESALAKWIDDLAQEVPDMRRAIFNLHVPPFASELDTAPQLSSDLRMERVGGATMTAPVGSTAVRSAIERYQPLLGLHGHIHESKGAVRIGRTLCINPGSSYNSGVLDGAIVRVQGDTVKSYQLVTG